jgi:hypothetical protein
MCPRLSAAIDRLAMGNSHSKLSYFDYFFAVVNYDFN